MKHRSLVLSFGFLVSFAVILAQVLYSGARKPEADEFVYLTIARDLHDTGTFTDGLFAPKGREQEPGRFFAPAYPYFLAQLSRVDPALLTFVRCHAGKHGATQSDCTGAPISLLVVQSAIAALGMAMLMVIAHVLSGSSLIAVFAMGLTLAASQSSYFPRTYLTENFAFLGFYFFLASGTVALAERRTSAYALAGAAIAFASLARPSFLYLFYACTLALPILIVAKGHQYGVRWRDATLFVVTAIAVLSPWMIRNSVIFGDGAITAGYSGFILVQRVAYNAMTWSEWAVSFVYWLPDFGPRLIKALFSPEVYARLTFDDPQSFYLVGNRALMTETLKAAGGREAHLSFLLKNYVLNDLPNHMLVTIPLALRGMWGAKYLALAGVALLIPVGRIMAERGMGLPFMFFVLSQFFMVGLHGFVSVNVQRYNIPVAALFAFVVAFSIVEIGQRLRVHRDGQRKHAPAVGQSGEDA